MVIDKQFLGGSEMKNIIKILKELRLIQNALPEILYLNKKTKMLVVVNCKSRYRH